MMNQKVVVLNAGKMNYDGKLDFSALSPDVTAFDDSNQEEIIDRIQDACVVVTKELPVTSEMIRSFPDSVKLICEAGTGYNNIALDAARERGIKVCNVPAYSSHRVAHTAVMLMLNLASTMQTQIKMLDKGDKSNFTDYLKVPHIELNGKTIGVVGTGNIGRQVIRIAQAMDMKVLCSARRHHQDEDNMKFVSLDELLKSSDFITLHCPLTPETHHMINEKTLAMMKSSAFLINTSRGALIDECALIKALQNHQIAGAGLDVQEIEPPADDNPLFTLDNVIITPHMGWKGMETRQRLVGVLANNVRGFFAGNPVNIVSD
ncbi:NAD(P)-dependent oxidoreductase [Anaerovibrio sp.]|uniref:NAD(P)-dependent oxidoreductase n=1 Tax=Anaerovibrio sp. TaxID=1872532 RepID=UPI003890546F